MERIATLTTSPVRRLFGTFAQVGVGGMMIYVAAVYPPQNPVALVFVLALGVLLIWLARNLWMATGRELILTRESLEDSSGRVLCRLDQIDRVERGAFSFKPSNGFLILLKEPAPKAWCPGLWWRLGKRIGVGGTTSGRASRDMADMIAFIKDGRELPDFSDFPENRDDK